MLFFGKSDVGKVRSVNEDNFIAIEMCENLLLCVICDGLGGHKGGEIASDIAILTFSDYVKMHLRPFINPGENMFDMNTALLFNVNIEEILIKAVSAANSTICQRSDDDNMLKDMCTTLTAALIIDNTLYAANVGDSRIYLISDDKMNQITHDHSFAQALIDTGKSTIEEAAKSPYSNRLTRVVGRDSFIETDTDIYILELNSSSILMCSDGLYNYSEPDQYSEFLKDVTDIDTLTSAVDNLVESANSNGGKDNITVIVIKNFSENPEPTGN